MKNTKCKFIVIDGTDGSGKTTQFNLLSDKLKDKGFTIRKADFPQYGQKSAGLVEEYLNGKYGRAEKVGPYVSSIFYAVDRYDAGFKIKKWLKQGNVVIANRYVSANMGHQGGKIPVSQDRKKYFKWLYDLEYGILKIPKPDLNIILHVKAEISQQLIREKEAHGRDRSYIKKTDIHENDINHLRSAEKVYLEMTRTLPGFILIECVSNGKILPREEIHKKIWQEFINFENTL